MSSEIDKLLQELRSMKSEAKPILENTPETWSKIRKGDLAGLGFSSQAELEAWISENPYANM